MRSLRLNNDIIFSRRDAFADALGLIQTERKEVYLATAELVQNRLNKARSV